MFVDGLVFFDAVFAVLPVAIGEEASAEVAEVEADAAQAERSNLVVQSLG